MRVRTNLSMDMSRLNFADRKRTTLWQRLLLALLALGVLLASAVAGMQLNTILHLRGANAALVASPGRGVAPASVRAPSLSPSRSMSLPAAQLLAANAAISTLNTPWTQILGGLKRSKSDKVAILELESKPLLRQMHIVAEADNTDALYDFVDAIGREAVFRRTSLISQERIEALASGAGSASVRMSFDVEWRE